METKGKILKELVLVTLSASGANVVAPAGIATPKLKKLGLIEENSKKAKAFGLIGKILKEANKDDQRDIIEGLIIRFLRPSDIMRTNDNLQPSHVMEIAEYVRDHPEAKASDEEIAEGIADLVDRL